MNSPSSPYVFTALTQALTKVFRFADDDIAPENEWLPPQPPEWTSAKK